MDADHESLELAMALHRELNAPQRRSRREIEKEKELKEEQKRREEEDSSSSSSSDEDDHGDASDRKHGETKAHVKGTLARPGKRRRRTPPRQLDPHEIAAATAVQRAAKSKNGGPIGGRTHCKCFVAGIPWGVIIPKEALESRHSLSEAVSKAFEKDGFVCRAEELEISIVAGTLKKTVEHFSAVAGTVDLPVITTKNKDVDGVLAINSNVYKGEGDMHDQDTGGGGGGEAAAAAAAGENFNESDKEKEKAFREKEEKQHQEQERWAAATQHAQRVYMSRIKLQSI